MADIIQIRMQLTGARETAAEARIASGAIAGTGTAAARAGAGATSSARRFARARGVIAAFGRAARTAALGAAGGAVAFGFEAKHAAETTQELAKTTAGLNRNLFDNTRAASEWAAVARARDIDSRSLNMSFTTLSRNLNDLKAGSDTAKASFGLLGLEQKDLAKANGDFKNQLLIVADAFGQAGAGTERQAAAQKLLGRGYQSILPLFTEGRKSLEQQTRWARKLGSTMGDKTLKEQARLRKETIKAKLAWQGFEVLLGTKVVPVLTDVVNKVLKFVTQMRKGKGAGGDFADAMGDVWDVLKDVWEVVKDVGKAIGDTFGWMKRAGMNIGKFVLPGWRAFKDLLAAIGRAAETVYNTLKDVAEVARDVTDFADPLGVLPGSDDRAGGITSAIPSIVQGAQGAAQHGGGGGGGKSGRRSRRLPDLLPGARRRAAQTGGRDRQPIILELDGREIARAVVDVGAGELARA